MYRIVYNRLGEPYPYSFWNDSPLDMDISYQINHSISDRHGDYSTLFKDESMHNVRYQPKKNNNKK